VRGLVDLPPPSPPRGDARRPLDATKPSQDQLLLAAASSGQTHGPGRSISCFCSACLSSSSALLGRAPRDSTGRLIPMQPAQQCPYCSAGVLVKQRGPAAIRWLCDTCTRTAVDAGSIPPQAADVHSWSFEAILPWCTVRRGPAGEHEAGDPMLASVYVADTAVWQLPWPQARWLRDSVITHLGCVSETTCAAGILLWLEGQVSAREEDGTTLSVEARPRPWQLVRGALQMHWAGRGQHLVRGRSTQA